jgi:hypothetical protein
MPADDHRLTTPEMARFVVDGFLRFDGLVPDALNARAVEEMRLLLPVKLARFGREVPEEPEGLPQPVTGVPLSACHPPPSAIGEVLRLPAVRGVIASLVGPDPVYDHDFVHFVPAGSPHRQHLHVDAIVDSADPGFDVQLFYFATEVRPGEGGTRIVPGTHLRRVRAEGLGRYQRIRGEQQISCPAGTVLVAHHGLWHAGQPNPGARERWMYKIRLGPTVPQVRLWNTADLEALQNDASDHVFATVPAESVGRMLRRRHPWQRGHEERYDLRQRALLWRHLTGDATYDVDYYLTRVERRDALAPAGERA